MVDTNITIVVQFKHTDFCGMRPTGSPNSLQRRAHAKISCYSNQVIRLEKLNIQFDLFIFYSQRTSNFRDN